MNKLEAIKEIRKYAESCAKKLTSYQLKLEQDDEKSKVIIDLICEYNESDYEHSTDNKKDQSRFVQFLVQLYDKYMDSVDRGREAQDFKFIEWVSLNNYSYTIWPDGGFWSKTTLGMSNMKTTEQLYQEYLIN